LEFVISVKALNSSRHRYCSIYLI